MYRGRLWTMRMFAGFGTPEDTNARFHYLLAQGQTGLSTAFDMPTLMGYDADPPRARGEVGVRGRRGRDARRHGALFARHPARPGHDVDDDQWPGVVLLAMYVALADKRGVPRDQLGGTVQNDMLKEFIAQKEWISPPAPAVRIVTDMIEFCAAEMPRWNPVSICGYHIREAGSTAAQELAFTLADGLAYVEAALARGLDVDDFAPRLSFFFDVHNDFFEEIAKFRAARRIWATLMRERFGAKKPESCSFARTRRPPACRSTAQQPLNNVARVALQALAAVLGGTQSLHTNSFDETLALPTEEAVTVALRTQQIIAEETRRREHHRPARRLLLRRDADRPVEAEAREYIERIDDLGGMVGAIERAIRSSEIADAAYRYQRRSTAAKRSIVGVNKYAIADERPVAYLESTRRSSASRSSACAA